MASHTQASLPRGMRLFELLEQQQEPFLLEVCLLEKSHSLRARKSDHTMLKCCWPIDSCKNLINFSSYGFKWRRRKCKALPCRNLFRRALNFHIITPEKGTKKAFACFPGKSEEPKLQLSPVSVLEFLSDEGCSFKNTSSGSSLNSEKYESRSNALFQSEQLLLQCVEELEESILESHEAFGQRQIFSLEKQRGNVSRLEQLIEVPFHSRAERSYFQYEKREIGKQIEELIFESIKEDCVSEMLCPD